MDIATIIGYVMVVVLMMIGMGFDISPFVDVQSLAIVAGGTFGALFISYPLPVMLKSVFYVQKAFLNKVPDLVSTINNLVSFAEKARREGLLALEGDIEEVDNEFLKKGVQLIVDGTEPELVQSILDSEVSFIEERHKLGKDLMEDGASYGPAYGMLGTLIGLILMLGNLSDPSSLGPSMAIALITTLYGSFIANVIFSPIATKLGYYSGQEILSKQLIIEGILSIQAGDNPKVVEEKLKSFLPPTSREELGEGE
ncbi:MAG: motility protein A [Fusobacteriota bacterium]